jgi:hypothetical protein
MSIRTLSFMITELSCSKIVVRFAELNAETARMALRTLATSQIITAT